MLPLQATSFHLATRNPYRRISGELVPEGNRVKAVVLPLIVFLGMALPVRSGARNPLRLPKSLGQWSSPITPDKSAGRRSIAARSSYWILGPHGAAPAPRRCAPLLRRTNAMARATPLCWPLPLTTTKPKSISPAFMNKYKMDFPVLVGTTVNHLHLFEMGGGLPCTVFLDTEGRVFARIFGEVKKKDVFERVEWLLSVRKGRNPKPPKPVLGKITLAP